jgi:hypothetical protein
MTVELGTVSHGSSVLTESLDSALEALALGDAGSIYMIAFSEDVGLDFLSQLIFGRVVKTELTNITLCGNAGLLEVACLRLVRAVTVSNGLNAVRVFRGDLFLVIYEADLNCLIAVVLYRLDLGNYAGTSLKNSNGDELAVVAEDLGHTQLPRKYCLVHKKILL